MIQKGYNVTVLCYGMTGSGKTHTMFGSKAHTEKVINLLLTRGTSVQSRLRTILSHKLRQCVGLVSNKSKLF